MNPRLRLGLLLAIAATLVQVLATDGSDGIRPGQAGVVMAEEPHAARAVPPGPAAGKEETLADQFRKAVQGRLAGPATEAPTINLFSAKSWYVPPPPPPPPKPLPPPPPMAPPLPFAFMGQYLEPGGHQVIFLVKGDRLYTTSPGEVIDGTYRVEGIQSGQLGLTYLPLNIKQTMFVGETS
ncbi:MAG: hypothetical protein PHR30_06340 [Gallionellaceae bacterium]|nr:hypothetical protein [Gallionellaceae bacterium]MDD5364942.1 hypothetical protein [Gallionellaceae bacterium]